MRNRRSGLIETDTQIDRTPMILLKRIQSWVGCTVALVSAGFFLLMLREALLIHINALWIQFPIIGSQ